MTPSSPVEPGGTLDYGTYWYVPASHLNPPLAKRANPQISATQPIADTGPTWTHQDIFNPKKLRRNFPAKTQVCCKSHNLVYCLTCGICGLQYVGQTKRTLHEKLYEHFRDIQNKDPTKPLGQHFALPNHTPDTTQVTSHILAFITKPSNTSAAQEIDREWIFRLRTSLLNAMD